MTFTDDEVGRWEQLIENNPELDGWAYLMFLHVKYMLVKEDRKRKVAGK